MPPTADLRGRRTFTGSRGPGGGYAARAGEAGAPGGALGAACSHVVGATQLYNEEEWFRDDVVDEGATELGWSLPGGETGNGQGQGQGQAKGQGQG